MSNSLFFDYPCNSKGDGDRAATVTDLAWCKSENLLACALDSGRVAIYQDEGAEVAAASIVRDNKQRASVMDWSPRGRLLAIGWMDGQVSAWSVMETLQDNASSCTCSNQGVHKQPITVMLWNPSGTRLITGDKGGVVCVWKADARGNMAPSVQYRRKTSAVTAAVFCGGPSHSADALAQAFSPSFFFATEAGTVSYADDLGHCSEVQQLTSAVDRLVFYEAVRRLVIITRSLLMTQLQVGEDGRVSQFMKVKLSVSASSVRESGLREVAWAGPGLLAAATGEGLVRFWDLSSDKNYVLTLQSGGLDRVDKSSCISFDPVRRYLAVGSTFGCVAIWKYVGAYDTGSDAPDVNVNSSSSTSPKSSKGKGRTLPLAKRPTSPADSGGPHDWKALAPTTLDSVPIGMLRWGAAGGVLGAFSRGMADGAHVLAETVLHRHLSGNVAVIQLTSDTLRIEYQRKVGSSGLDAELSGGGGSGVDSSLEGEQVVRCDISVKGFHLQGEALLVHNSKQAQLIQLRGPGLSPHKGATWPCAARSVAVDDTRDQAFVASGSRVDIYNLKGGFKSSLTFSETEGSPILVSLCGSFLAVATDKGSIKLYDVSKRSKVDTSTLPVRPLGTTGAFVCPTTGKSLGLIRSIRCNADGTRVSILSDKVHGQTLKIRSPDSRIYVYGSDKDSVESYDWGPQGRVPTTHFWDPEEPRLLAVEARRVMARDPSHKSKNEATPATDEEEKEGRMGSESKYGGDSEAAAAAKSSARAKSATLGDSVACEAEVWTKYSPTLHTNDWEPEPDRL